MNCKKCHSNLIVYLEGGLRENERPAMEAHLKACEKCAGYATYLNESLQVIENEKNIDPAPFMFTRIKARMTTPVIPTYGKVWQIKLQPAFFTVLLLVAIYSGIRIGSRFSTVTNEDFIAETLLPAINEMKAEPLELFLME
jgi:anti-sigma factor RsiW